METENEEVKYKCADCQDTGVIITTEWAEPNESYEVEKKCHCQLT